MKQTIRDSCFETNSSMTHSLVIDTEENFEKWRNGELIWDEYKEELVPSEECEGNRYEFSSYNEFSGDLETESGSFTTPSGEKIKWRARYGYDG